MRGYAYVDLDRNVVYKVAEYIETENPGFFSHNSHLIVRHWKFDTDDINSMKRMFMALQDLAIPANNVTNFIKSIRFDMNRLKTSNAS